MESLLVEERKPVKEKVGVLSDYIGRRGSRGRGWWERKEEKKMNRYNITNGSG